MEMTIQIDPITLLRSSLPNLVNTNFHCDLGFGGIVGDVQREGFASPVIIEEDDIEQRVILSRLASVAKRWR
ncbi:hypothetical protein [Rosistilla oblonga]|uniref:hypothetical protein n=1 Tax=Rosistilla oblonga TaxID=2527990 RepID=UPI003A97C90A